MTRLLISYLLLFSIQMAAMECPGNSREISLTVEVRQPVAVGRWIKKVVKCVRKPNSTALNDLLNHPPVTRGQYSLNEKIFAEISEHRDEELDALRTRCGRKKVWNRFRALCIDIGLPVCAGALGIAGGILADEPWITALSAAVAVLTLPQGIKDAIGHWTMKEYEGKVEEFDVWLMLMKRLQELENKGGEKTIGEIDE